MTDRRRAWFLSVDRYRSAAGGLVVVVGRGSIPDRPMGWPGRDDRRRKLMELFFGRRRQLCGRLIRARTAWSSQPQPLI